MIDGSTGPQQQWSYADISKRDQLAREETDKGLCDYMAYLYLVGLLTCGLILYSFGRRTGLNTGRGGAAYIPQSSPHT